MKVNKLKEDIERYKYFPRKNKSQNSSEIDKERYSIIISTEDKKQLNRFKQEVKEKFRKEFVKGPPPYNPPGGGDPVEAEAWIEGDIEEVEDFIFKYIDKAIELGKEERDKERWGGKRIYPDKELPSMWGDK